MYFIFLCLIILTILMVVRLNTSLQKKNSKAGEITLQKNIIELSKKRTK